LDKIGLEFIDLYKLFQRALKVEHDRIDDLQTLPNRAITIDERIETTVNAILKVIEANNKQIRADLSRQKE
jgi:hypothetical protein